MSNETKPDGGPAFPCDWKDFQPTTGEQIVREQYQGMSLRAYFAGQALVGYCASDSSGSSEAIAINAVSVANALIAELNKNPNS